MNLIGIGLPLPVGFEEAPPVDPKEARRDYLRRYQLRWMNRRRDEWICANGPCARCGSSDRLEVDHRDPGEKVTHLVWSLAKEKRDAELAKCQVLCHECHLRKTAFDVFPLSEDDVSELVRRVGAGETKTSLAREFGVTRNTLYRILDGDVPWLRTYPRPAGLRR